MTILLISVDLECFRCRAKITRVLDCLKDEFCIEKVEFDDKLNKVIVRGNFCGEKLSKKICCKAGKIVKEIKTVDVWPPPPPPKPDPPKEEKPKEDPKPEEKPKEEKPKEEKPKEEKPKEEKPKEEAKPPPPKPEVKYVPYPYPLPYPWSQSWACPCPPQRPCQCPPPRPWCPCPPQQECQCTKPRPWPHCTCSSKDDDDHGRCRACGGKPDPPAKPPCQCGGRPPCSCGTNKPQFWWPPPPPGVCPPPAWCNIITDDNPGCSIM